MRALEYPGPGGAACTARTVEAVVPRPGPGQVLVRVEAAGLPPVGGTPAGVPGTEFAGVVVQLGPGTYGLEVGDEVLGHCPSGACAEYAAADADRVAHRPAALPWAEAALLPVTAAGVREHAALRESGAVPIGYGAQLAERVRAAAPQGVDAVLDAVGAGTAPLWPELAGGPERVASPVPPVGRTVGAAESAELGEMVELWEEGAFRLVPDTVLGLEEAAAHRPPGAGTLAVVVPRT
ncbi:alcohol dehydrogenase catalytic domain-containing protein [Kitasatospora sp. DSM 101779]|uniref:alcohol dehydrogenase catalytic domain-containing protein n=1 Tax=Kitasatospora sp. DSM 101779 TaxID=2853165 RepID=UPI0021DAB9BD|nr:alcohol dehydrogenase catalytic domain-containing protein [Kitasatospora sp. DSM 101779]MCU7824655.1 alcohol dehydrogenase catalytic domain-containing protein [Kitasatospora sp. DSM 101779]